MNINIAIPSYLAEITLETKIFHKIKNTQKKIKYKYVLNSINISRNSYLF